MQHGLFLLYAGASLFGTKGELQKNGTKRKKTPNVAKKVLPAKLKVEAQSNSDILDKDSRDDLTSDEDCPVSRITPMPRMQTHQRHQVC